MSKPQLPSVPESVRERAYKPSGKWTSRSLALMSGLGLPAAAIIGVVGHYVGLVFPLLVGLLVALFAIVGNLCGMLGCLGALTIIFSVLLFGFLYPAAAGAAIGYVTWLLALRSKCRSSRWAASIGLLGGAVGYSVLSFITFQRFGMVRLSSQMVSTYLELTNTPWWLYVLVGLDALVFVGIATLVPYTQVKETPFCEGCEEWYGSWKDRKFSLEIAEPLLQALETGSAQTLRTLEEISSVAEHPYLEVKLRRCPSCDISDFQVAASAAWKEVTTDKEGQKKTEIKTEEWFKAMAPADLGTQLDEILFSKE